MRRRKTQVDFNQHEKQVDSEPYIEYNSTSTLPTEIDLIWTTHTKTK